MGDDSYVASLLNEMLTLQDEMSMGESEHIPDSRPLVSEAEPPTSPESPQEPVSRPHGRLTSFVSEKGYKDVLAVAKELTDGDRQASYGPPDQDFAKTAALVSILLQKKLAEPLEAEDVATFMLALKLSRLEHSKKRDSVIDLAGYVRCLDVCILANGGYDA
jgi:hypothetical protein